MVRRPVALAAGALLLLSGCGAAGQANPETIGPRGVDELVVPTPDPDPDDFVDVVDNPWLPLAPGTVWTYDVAGQPTTSVEVRVEERRETVAGVECVVVHTTTVNPTAQPIGVRRYYAQDRSGNVWLFGERPEIESGGAPSWMAGQEGAEAGIAMLATPRVGDGYLHAAAAGVAERSTVLALDEEVAVPAGTFAGLLLTEDTLSESGDLVVQRYYAEGTGLLAETTTVGGSQRLVLRSVVEAAT